MREKPDPPAAPPPADILRLVDSQRRVVSARTAKEAARITSVAARELLDAELVVVVDESGLLAAAPDEAAPVEHEAVREVEPGIPFTIASGELAGRRAVAARLDDDREGRLVAIVGAGRELSFADGELIQGMGDVLTLSMRSLERTAILKRLRSSHHEETLKRQRTEADYSALMERIPAIVYTAEMGENGRWRFVSPKIEEILGFTAEEWTRRPGLWIAQVHPEDREYALSFETEASIGRPSAPAAVYRMLRRDGRIVWILENAQLELDDKGVPVWNGVMYDITDLKEAELGNERLARQQAMIADLGERALRGADAQSLMEQAVWLIADTEAIELSCVWTARNGALRVSHGRTRSGSPALEDEADADPGGYPHAALDVDSHLLIGDWDDPRAGPIPEHLGAKGIRSSLAVAIRGKRGPYGVIDAHSTNPHRFKPSDVHHLQAVANVLADAINRSQADDQLRRQLVHDALTGLPNRRRFTESLTQSIKRSAAEGTRLGLLFLDLDEFKLINDSLGHHAGDELLGAIGPRIRKILRPGDMVARFGGDEFAVTIDPLAGEAEAIEIAERVGEELAKPIEVDGVEQFVTASIGIVIFEPELDDRRDAEDLIRDADSAMYRAKERGKAGYHRFGPHLRERSVRRLETQRELRSALEREQFTLAYQPIVSLDTGEVSACEALLRWNHPRLGQVDPTDLIQMAEQIGIVEQVGSWVAERACREGLGWSMDVSVNVSARQITHHDLPRAISEILESTGLRPERLLLELTESALLEESRRVIDSFERLSAFGVRIMIDDFGTGYSSLAYLNSFPLNALKIDRSFIEGLESGRDSGRAIVEAIIAMARALSLKVIAEGVTTAGQLQQLRSLGCDFAQGYLFSRPAPPEAIPDLSRDPFPLHGR